jgi:hypothetical protein
LKFSATYSPSFFEKSDAKKNRNQAIPLQYHVTNFKKEDIPPGWHNIGKVMTELWLSAPASLQGWLSLVKIAKGRLVR